MRKVILLAVLAVAPGFAAAADNVELNSLRAADVAARMQSAALTVPAPADRPAFEPVVPIVGNFDFYRDL